VIGTRADIRRAAGRSIICGFEGTHVTPELKAILREVVPLGLVLFKRNIESPEQVAELVRELKMMRGDDALLLCVDQEGGRVQRIREPATVWPAMRQIGETQNPLFAHKIGKALGRELRAMNFDVNFAPVLDVDTNPDNPVIGDRAFSADPRQVAEMACAFIEGLEKGGIGACGKHFPGHGDTHMDSHLELPSVDHALGRLREVEWVPFEAAIQAGLGAVMTAHVLVPRLDEERPGTLSAAVLSHLRKTLAFDGVVVSDDVEMKALADHFSIDTIAVEGTNAGVDVFLPCKTPEVMFDLYRALVQGVEQEAISHRTLLLSEKRVVSWRDRIYRPAEIPETLHVLGCAEHQALLRSPFDSA